MANNIFGDDELNWSNVPTPARIDDPTNEIVIPDVEITGETPVECLDTDSVSTFSSKKSYELLKSALRSPTKSPGKGVDPSLIGR